MVVYVTKQGSRVVRQGRHLLVKQDGDTLHTLFTHKLQQLILCGNVTLTPPALRLLLHEAIDTVFLSRDGRYYGRLALAEPKNVFLRRMQFVLCKDPSFYLPVARAIVRGKMANMATVLMRLKRARKSKAAGDAARQVRDLLSGLSRADDLNMVRGFEGRASAVYFAALRTGFQGEWGFTKRVRRPPTDPVNAVLSLLYTFLINRVDAAVRIAGLDPYPGVLHSLEYGRHSLTMDLAEEFRTIVADTLTLSLFNLGILKKDDFRSVERHHPQKSHGDADQLDLVCTDPLARMDFTPSNDVSDLDGPQTDSQGPEELDRNGKPAVKLVPKAFRRVVEAFEKKLTTEFFHPRAEKRMTYAEALVFQARHFRKMLEGETEGYAPLLLK